MNPVIKNISCLSQSQLNYVLIQSKGMAIFGWKSVTIAWYSNGERAMIVEDFNGTIYPSQPIPLDSELEIINGDLKTMEVRAALAGSTTYEIDNK